ncbi:16S rRNA (adenine(1518)-N(6)/adenine(1519)-N(6))-dimethyltransferase RsmA [Geomicrobium sp. JCM 19039]|uniref:16S rRNA (adenine(1518)-N(6)/adenine(1519)-N(6))- dimethyltransferase RsmA n=1 Tax=Geomicrobium sp. JCM 19039 TaxID=1460636 RepID=UPI00045F2DBB|nr:16S rRNA (adenine(1518)-N(6)/adenine(1519)-N(6))-dimethyltransferase RsmA [Geomicrobium sp. JCM 19039]GAK13880.1 dimethyladenosine transferase [Geomicrobium sp. JCM 19039]
MKEIATPTRTKEIVERYNLKAKKSLGQNFMVDAQLLGKMVDHTGLTERDGVIEVGPGIGALTEQLAKRAKKVIAYEIDQRLLPVLDDTLSSYDNVDIRHEDFLKSDLTQVFKKDFSDVDNVYAAGNLPYYVTTPILMRFLEERLPIETLTVLIQKEVGDRLAAKPSTKAYGSLSIAAQYYAETEVISAVPPQAFMPRPNVDSSIITFRIRKEKAVQVNDEAFFFKCIRASFAQRRKTLRNNLNHWLGDKERVTEALGRSEIDGARRAETLSIQEFGKLADALNS